MFVFAEKADPGGSGGFDAGNKVKDEPNAIAAAAKLNSKPSAKPVTKAVATDTDAGPSAEPVSASAGICAAAAAGAAEPLRSGDAVVAAVCGEVALMLPDKLHRNKVCMHAVTCRMRASHTREERAGQELLACQPIGQEVAPC